MKKLVIIPAFNEEKSILNVVNKLKQNNPEYDYIVINDNSTDSTEKICQDNMITYISLPINLGIGGAMQTGYMYAYENGYDVAIQIDGDGQHDTKYLDVLVDKLQNCDICIGSRYIDKEGFQSTFMRRFGKNILSGWIKFLTGKKITDPTSGFRASNSKVIQIFAEKYPCDYPEPETIVRLIKNGYVVEENPVIMNDRKEGKSSITPLKSIVYMFKVMVAILFAYLERRERNDIN